MNLNEALTVLKENNYLVEFLQDTKVINPEKTINRISKELNINFKKLDNDNKFLCTDIDYTELTNQQIKKFKI